MINSSVKQILKSDFLNDTRAPFTIVHERDNLLSSFGKAVLKDRYLQQDESYQDLFARVARYYSDDDEHAARLYDYISNLWFMPATPILSNGGTQRGLPISCFLNETDDSLEGIVSLWNENVWLAARGGGVGSYWGNLRSIGERVKHSGKTSGIIPFIVVQNALTLAISQGSLRRGSSAVYLPVDHPEIMEFLDLRKPTGGDPNRKALNLHHAVVINDEFMNAVIENKDWDLVSPKDNEVIFSINARSIWIKILTARLETGEPYILFSDNTSKNRCEVYKRLGLNVRMSNLCSEITLATGKDQHGLHRTAICCLSSLNLEKFDEWEFNSRFIPDVLHFLDNVMQDFIERAPDTMSKAVYSAQRERSVGMGAMGFHSLLQKKGIPFESAIAKSINLKIFRKIKSEADAVSQELAQKKGACPDALECGLQERFANKMSIAPTASISIIAGNTSPGIEPYVANVFTQKTLSGSFVVQNPHLKRLLEQKGQDTPETWSSIISNEGSVQHLSFLSENEKMVFRTAYEIDQRWVIEHAADRTPFVCQSQSVNIFLQSDVHKRDLHQIHLLAWQKGLKTLYYCRSKSIQRAYKISHGYAQKNGPSQDSQEECLACQ